MAKIQSNVYSQAGRPSHHTMLQAIEAGDLPAIQVLLDQGVSVNKSLPNKEFPLHVAIRSDQNAVEIVQLLIRSGANLDAKDSQNLTALDRAILLEKTSLTEIILREKIGLSAKALQKQTENPYFPASFSELNNRLDQTLIIDPSQLKRLPKAAYEGNISELEKVRSKNELDQLDERGFAPIHYAILGGKHSAFHTLQKAGANPKILTREGNSILHLAAMKSSLPLIQLAFDSGIQANDQNRRGETALHYASMQEHLNGMKALIEKGADPSMADARGTSPLAVFMAKVRSKDPLSISPLMLPQAAFGALYLWQLCQLKASGSLTASWPPALSFAFLGLYAAQSIHFTNSLGKSEEKNLSLLGSLGAEWIPGLGLGWSLWKTGHIASSSLQMIKKGWDDLETRKWAALQNIAIGSVHLAASLAMLGTQTLVHAQWLQSAPESPGYSGHSTPSSSPQPRIQPYTPPNMPPLLTHVKSGIPNVEPEPQYPPFWIHGPQLPLPFLKLPPKFGVERYLYDQLNRGICEAPSYEKAITLPNWPQLTQEEPRRAITSLQITKENSENKSPPTLPSIEKNSLVLQRRSVPVPSRNPNLASRSWIQVFPSPKLLQAAPSPSPIPAHLYRTELAGNLSNCEVGVKELPPPSYSPSNPIYFPHLFCTQSAPTNTSEPDPLSSDRIQDILSREGLKNRLTGQGAFSNFVTGTNDSAREHGASEGEKYETPTLAGTDFSTTSGIKTNATIREELSQAPQNQSHLAQGRSENQSSEKTVTSSKPNASDDFAIEQPTTIDMIYQMAQERIFNIATPVLNHPRVLAVINHPSIQGTPVQTVAIYSVAASTILYTGHRTWNGIRSNIRKAISVAATVGRFVNKRLPKRYRFKFEERQPELEELEKKGIVQKKTARKKSESSSNEDDPFSLPFDQGPSPLASICVTGDRMIIERHARKPRSFNQIHSQISQSKPKPALTWYERILSCLPFTRSPSTAAPPQPQIGLGTSRRRHVNSDLLPPVEPSSNADDGSGLPPDSDDISGLGGAHLSDPHVSETPEDESNIDIAKLRPGSDDSKGKSPINVNSDLLPPASDDNVESSFDLSSAESTRSQIEIEKKRAELEQLIAERKTRTARDKAQQRQITQDLEAQPESRRDQDSHSLPPASSPSTIPRNPANDARPSSDPFNTSPLSSEELTKKIAELDREIEKTRANIAAIDQARQEQSQNLRTLPEGSRDRDSDSLHSVSSSSTIPGNPEGEGLKKDEKKEPSIVTIRDKNISLFDSFHAKDRKNES